MGFPPHRRPAQGQALGFGGVGPGIEKYFGCFRAAVVAGRPERPVQLCFFPRVPPQEFFRFPGFPEAGEGFQDDPLEGVVAVGLRSQYYLYGLFVVFVYGHAQRVVVLCHGVGPQGQEASHFGCGPRARGRYQFGVQTRLGFLFLFFSGVFSHGHISSCISSFFRVLTALRTRFPISFSTSSFGMGGSSFSSSRHSRSLWSP